MTDPARDADYFAVVRDRAKALVQAVDRDGLHVALPTDLLLRVAAMLDDGDVVHVDADADPVDGGTSWRVLVATVDRVVYASCSEHRGGGADRVDRLQIVAARAGDVRVSMRTGARADSRWRAADGAVSVDGHPGFVVDVAGTEVPLPLERTGPQSAQVARACRFAATLLERTLR